MDFVNLDLTETVRALTDTGVGSLGANPVDHFWVVVLAGICMFYMAWGIGANDCANNFATAWGSGALSFKTCIGIAAVMEAAGAIFLGSNVAKTFRKGIANPDLYEGPDGRILVYVGMTSVLFSAATWLLVASRFGLPVSTTHSAVGGVISFAIVTKGYSAVVWDKVGMIVASWFISPLLSMVCSFLVYACIKKFVLEKEDSLARTAKAAPLLAFLTAFIIAMFVFYKGAKGIGLHKTDLGVAIGISCGIAAFIALGSVPIARHVHKKLDALEDKARGLVPTKPKDVKLDLVEGFHNAATPDMTAVVKPADLEKADVKKEEESTESSAEEAPMTPTEKLWCGFCWVTASFESLAHGGNDVANSVGPFAAVLAAHAGGLNSKTDVPFWVFVVAGVGICLGLAMYGRKVMETIGKNLTKLQPSKAFSAELSATMVILIATRLGIPISTTHASVGAVMGVGIADEGWKKGLNWNQLVKIFASWVFTLPIVGIFTAGVYGFLLPCVVNSPIVAPVV